MIIRVDTYIKDGYPKTAAPEADMTFESTRDIDYRRKADRVWLAKHAQWAYNNGRGVQTYRVR